MIACNAGPCRLAKTTRDAFLGGRLTLEQPVAGYRAGQDPVLLAAATPIEPGQSFVDLGCGVGTLGLCLAARVPTAVGRGLELDPDLAELGRKNARDYGFEVQQGDLAHAAPILQDWVLSNPPFFTPGAGRLPANLQRRQGRHGTLGLEAWLQGVQAWVKPRGRLGLVLASAQVQIALHVLGPSFGGFVLKPLLGKADRPIAERCLLFARQGSKSDLVLAAPLAVRQRSGDLSPEAQRILLEGAALTIPPIR